MQIIEGSFVLSQLETLTEQECIGLRIAAEEIMQHLIGILQKTNITPAIINYYYLFRHVVRPDDHTPAHRALSQVAAARTGSRFGPGWRRRPGHPGHSWIQQIGDGTPFSIRAEWSKARRRGHSGLTQRTSAAYAI